MRNFRGGVRAGLFRLAHKLDRIAIELRIERKPAHAHRIDLQIHEVLAREAAVRRVIVGVGPSHIATDRCGHSGTKGHFAAGAARIQSSAIAMRAPGRHGSELFLAGVVIDPAAVHAHAAAQDQRRNSGAVVQIVVVPVIDAGADNDGAFAIASSRR